LTVTILVATGVLTLVPYINKPNIDFQVNQVDGPATIITVTNKGFASATHIILTVQSPQNIVKEKVIFSTENITKTKNETRTIQYYLPRLVQGSGSIEIFIQTKEKPNTAHPNFLIYATYDQGSIKFENQKPIYPCSLTLDNFINNFINSYNPFYKCSVFNPSVIPNYFKLFNPYDLAIGLILGGIIMGFYLGGLLIIRRSKTRTNTYKLIEYLIDFRKMLMDPQKSKDDFKDLSDFGDLLKMISYRILRDYNLPDYLLLKDLDIKVEERSLALKEQPVGINKIIGLNAECLDLCERALREVDWTKKKGKKGAPPDTNI